MKGNFALSLTFVLQHEGGFVDDKRDPGGRTNHGVTQTVYDDWRVANGLPERSVRDITNAEITLLYKGRYWDKIRGDELPSGVDYCVFDFAVNSGINRAARYLQEAAGADVDGVIGPATLSEVDAEAPAALIDAICDARLAFLKRLHNFDIFGKGWARRVAEVRANAKAMA